MVFRKLIFIFSFFLLGLARTDAQSTPQKSTPTLVRVANGLLQGTLDRQTGILSFKGIPFAQPPIGNLRWRAPRPAKNWKGIRMANHFGPMAMQKHIFSDMRFRANTMSEDCLYLNVWTPAHSLHQRLPVLVYIFGGGFIAGDGSEWRYDGASLAQKGIVVVTINYRLGIFGFFAHPDLTRESIHHASGNYGLLDQQAALVWVKRNIASFGGNPDQITIGGESAGSISVFAQMASPLSRNLISGAIGESGAMVPPTMPAISLAQGEKNGLAFAERVGAKSLARLRSIPAQKLLDESSGPGAFKVNATIDGYFLPQSPTAIFASGEQAHIPLLVGWNSTEVSYWSLLDGKAPTPGNYARVLKKLYGQQAGEVLKLFPGSTQAEVIHSATDLASDRFIVFSTWKWSDWQRRTGGRPVYRYLFARGRPALKNASQVISKSSFPAILPGAVHSAEIEYALGNLSTNPVYSWSAADRRVSATMEGYFARFIKTGNPNGPGLPTWLPNTKNGPVRAMHINVRSQMEPEHHPLRYDFLDRFYLH
ncbi:MAG: carboxylesterase/lipase family protein [Chitinophagaceae bacterium]